jgi:hypothetical protein
VIPRLSLLRTAGRARLALGAAAGLALALAFAPGELAPVSLRAAAAACAIGAAALWARSGLAQPAAASRLALVSRQALSREAGVVLLEVDGRPVLIGFGAGGVQLLEAGTRPASAPPAPPPASEARP